MRLGVLVRGEESLASDGLNKRAFWSCSRRMLAVVVRVGWSPHRVSLRRGSACIRLHSGASRRM